ncbi:hypothetical protein B0T24DRAFT_535131 [Lasiosphaeria ovina]|uniref:2-dehydropantoate 2-reductase n=1 Tax=Lasiosphaeria ovina TaxID=92902 RepID=A0AAE0K0B5_9PEZI|nr:hypothetical protein B0T24DRAFT_535131 [Lasiosphaeria ovina]
MLKEREKTIKRLITDISGDRRPSESRRGPTPASSSPYPEDPSPPRKAPTSDRFAAVLNVQPEDTASSQSSQPTSYPSPTSTTENIATSTKRNGPASVTRNANIPFESEHEWSGDEKTLDERLDPESAEESVDHHEVLPHQTKTQARLKLWDADSRRAEEDEPARRPARFRGSDQIHIVGGGLGGLHIAHHLAGCHTLPPARYLFHSLSLMKKFIKAGRQLTLHTSGGTAVHDRIIPEAQSRDKPNNEIIANLIVACLAHNVNYAVGTIKHRLNSSSTICLIQDGLGVAESLIETHFPDEASRPAILLGHWTTQIETADEPFAAVEKKPGRLYLSIYTSHNQNRAVSLIKRHPPVERVVKSTHLLRLLAQIPGLNATGHPPAQFLRAKLPAVTFRAIVEPLSALFDCHYDKLLTQDAKHLVNQLLSEVFLVISRLPETRGIVGFEDSMAVASWLRPKIYEKLYRRRHHFNDRERMKFRGGQVELDYLTGYFVQRGRELNVYVKGLETVLQMIRIKKYFDWQARLEQLKAQGGGGGGGAGPKLGGGGSGQDQAQQRQ